MSSPEAAAAFSAIEAIQSGDWDHFLLRLRAAIIDRLRTDAYYEHLTAQVKEDEMARRGFFPKASAAKGASKGNAASKVSRKVKDAPRDSESREAQRIADRNKRDKTS